MHIEVVPEGMQQTFVLGQVSHDAQLDLRVVRRHQFVAERRDKRLADTPAFGGANWDVLQVRVTGRQPSGGCDGLMVGGVNAPSARVDLLRQAIGVSAFQLTQAAVLHQHLGQRVILLGQFGQHRFGGRGLALGRLAQHWQAELFIEDNAQLLGRAEVELLTGNGKGLTLQLHQLVAQLDALNAQQLGIHQRALTLDTRQHRHQRHLDLGQHLGQARDGLQLRPQRLVQTQGDVGIFRRVGAGQLQSNLVEGQLLGALAGNVLEGDGAVVEVFEGQGVHVVARGGGVQHVGFEHAVEGHALHVNAVAWVAVEGTISQHVDVVLGVLTDLGFVRIFQQRLERLEHRVAI